MLFLMKKGLQNDIIGNTFSPHMTPPHAPPNTICYMLHIAKLGSYHRNGDMGLYGAIWGYMGALYDYCSRNNYNYTHAHTHVNVK